MRVNVTVDDGHLDQVHAVAGRLRERGMDVDAVLEAAGVISGSVTDERARALAGVEGVASVDAETETRLPPPDEPQ